MKFVKFFFFVANSKSKNLRKCTFFAQNGLVLQTNFGILANQIEVLFVKKTYVYHKIITQILYLERKNQRLT